MKDLLPGVEYDELSHIIKIEKKEKEHIGKIAICTAGTADIAVAEEAAQTAEYFGSHVERIFDVGVSGIHRLFSRAGCDPGCELRDCSCRNGGGAWQVYLAVLWINRLLQCRHRLDMERA